ncbi:MAG TPA: phosphoribosylglycinamide formyltransferase [Vicinamibacterales bacterium]|nr:phosphoribosylglycinamide formyltransferase [Vicinamibacterales bacterium]
MTRRLGVLISGRGSNLQAILAAIDRGDLDAEVGIVVSNKADAPGLSHARAAGIATEVLDHRQFPTRDDYDAAMVERLRAHDIGLVCLAGFMRLLGPAFVRAFPDAILNVHPSLLPAFPGLDAQRQAFEHGVKLTGCTVHFVNDELDAGPIVLQTAVAVLPEDTVESLAARILVEEHRLYPRAIAMVLSGRWRIDGRRFVDVTSSFGA